MNDNPLLFISKYSNKMAQMEPGPVRRTKYAAAHKKLYVDLTPMVDLGFLLISFFMLSTTLASANSTDLVMPKDAPVQTLLKETTVLTLMPVNDNDIGYFEGRNAAPGTIRHATYGELRKIIQHKQQKVARIFGDQKETVIIIDPGAFSSYKNFMDILDEIQINDIRHYFVVDHHSPK